MVLRKEAKQLLNAAKKYPHDEALQHRAKVAAEQADKAGRRGAVAISRRFRTGFAQVLHGDGGTDDVDDDCGVLDAQ